MAIVDLSGQERFVDHGSPGYNIGWEFVNSPEPGSIIQGGAVIGTGVNRKREWDYVHGLGNGAAIRWEVDNLTIRRHYTRYTWDPFKPRGSAPVIEDCWIKEGRDDGVEHDAVNSLEDSTLYVRRCFFDYGHTFLSITPGQGVALARPVTVHWHDCVMSLGHHLDGDAPCEDREKRRFAWSDFIHGSGQPFKVRGINGGGGDGITLNFDRNHVMIRYGMNTAKSNLRFFQDMTVRGSGNVFYYLGDFKGLTRVAWKGGFVPAEFALERHPDVWERVSNSEEEWNAVVERWVDTVWNGEVAPPPPPPPPEPSPDCAAEIAAAVAPLNARIAALTAELQEVRRTLADLGMSGATASLAADEAIDSINRLIGEEV